MPKAQGLSDDELLELANNAALTESDIALLTQAERKHFMAMRKTVGLETLEALQKRRIAHVQSMLPFWIIPIVALYAVGFTVRWISRGFK